ncbi:hypothetical protein SORBI_3K014100 [Sorghum bicolor]|nr:hypothetical protein SORBI_3K014100 [Sorghum bicolor]
MNHYILAGLCGTLMVSAVVTITSVVLSPAQVTFSVVRATSMQVMLSNVTNLMVTIAVYNPSRRCQARYQSVSINLKNSSTGAGTRSSIPANVVPADTFPMDYVRGPNITRINSMAGLVETQKDRASGYAYRLHSGAAFTVEVTAQVRFKIGVTPTRLYDMKVFCPGVVFIDDNNSSSTAQLANQQNFNCSG